MVNVEIGPMGSSAYVSNDKYDWTLSIRKKDGTAVGSIISKNKEQVDSQYLRDYLVEWEEAQWERLKTPQFFPQELMAECGDYILHIILPETSTASESLIAEEFNEFMRA